MRLNGVLEGKCNMAAQKAAFIVSERILWWYMCVHQREGAIGAVGALECLIPCVYGLSRVFSGALVALARCKGGKAVRSVFLWVLLWMKCVMRL